jgi:cell wall-associated NlpC family hydrolase
MAVTGLGKSLGIDLPGLGAFGDGGGEHVVREGETIEGIAKQHGLRPEELLAANLDLVDQGRIGAGDKLRIPARGEIGDDDIDALMGKIEALMGQQASKPRPAPRNNAGQRGGQPKAQPPASFSPQQMSAPTSTRTSGGGGGGNGTTNTGGGTTNTGTTNATQTTGSPSTSSVADLPDSARGGAIDIPAVLQRYQGGSYVYGGGRDGAGYGTPGAKSSDCSAFVSAVWADKGLKLAAHTDGAYNQLKGLGAKSVPLAEAKPGDIVFYMGAGTGGAISHHVGIYAGNGKVLDQSSSNGGGVQLRDVNHGGRFEILRDPRAS